MTPNCPRISTGSPCRRLSRSSMIAAAAACGNDQERRGEQTATCSHNRHCPHPSSCRHNVHSNEASDKGGEPLADGRGERTRSAWQAPKRKAADPSGSAAEIRHANAASCGPESATEKDALRCRSESSHAVATAVLRRARPKRPSRPEPSSQAAAGIGTTWTRKSCVSLFTMANRFVATA